MPYKTLKILECVHPVSPMESFTAIDFSIQRSVAYESQYRWFYSDHVTLHKVFFLALWYGPWTLGKVKQKSA